MLCLKMSVFSRVWAFYSVYRRSGQIWASWTVFSWSSPSPQHRLVHRNTLWKYHYFTDSYYVPLAGEDRETPVEWSPIKWSGVKFFNFRKSNRAASGKGREQNEEPWETRDLNEIHCNIFWLGTKLRKKSIFLRVAKVRGIVLKFTGSCSYYVQCYLHHRGSVCCLIGCHQSVSLHGM